MVTEVTDEVVTVTVAEVAPAATVALAGMLATDGLEDVRATRAPPAGAGPLSVTVAVEERVPRTLFGERLNVYAAEEGVVVRSAVFVTPPLTAVIVARPVNAVEAVVTVNVASCDPATMVMLEGTVAREGTELVRVTLFPPVGAGPDRLTVAVAPEPPTMLV